MGNVDSPNEYLYVTNNPLKYVDPYGREKVLIIDGDENNSSPSTTGYVSAATQLEIAILEKQGIKPINITVLHASTVSDFTGELANSSQYKQVFVIAHGSQNSITFSSQNG